MPKQDDFFAIDLDDTLKAQGVEFPDRPAESREKRDTEASSPGSTEVSVPLDASPLVPPDPPSIDADAGSADEDALEEEFEDESSDSVLDLDETVLEGALHAEAEYTLEIPARCPCCRATISGLLAIRLVRTRVSFISTLPRRGILMACPECRAVLPADLGGLL